MVVDSEGKSAPKLDLPRDQAIVVQIEPLTADPAERKSCLSWLAENAADCPSTPDDLAHQHDHYLYGTQKRTT